MSRSDAGSETLTLWCFDARHGAADALQTIAKNTPSGGGVLVEHVRLTRDEQADAPGWTYTADGGARTEAADRKGVSRWSHALGTALGNGFEVGRSISLSDACIRSGVPEEVETAATKHLGPDTSGLLLRSTASLPSHELRGLVAQVVVRVRPGKVHLDRGFAYLRSQSRTSS
ncbi:hypothetical protein [Luteimicrobium subarcticum]|uniref:Uncharacterized protein n=1 Tax=Luteimicrobium subarcticum TaxID=620910 RepID=A0A2M8W778_9MICO|nr:hypothetical protein [Luteimicrobium subarcticum]PJI86783.1 hypothetical protein CLV34_2706 [Luteimicrobium subarcticum]